MSTDQLEQLDQWAQEFEDFHARFAHLFACQFPPVTGPPVFG